MIKAHKCFVVVGFCFVTLLVFSLKTTKDIFPEQSLLDHYKNSSTVSTKKHVLLYTFFWEYLEGITLIRNGTTGDDEYELKDCPVKNCIFTNNKTHLESFSDYDAIIFEHGQVWEVDGTYWKLPDTRSPHQLYIMASQEPPQQTYFNKIFNSSFYNLTMTYRLDSDIYYGFGRIIDLATGKQIAPATNVRWKEPDDNFTDELILEMFKNKTKKSAWFVTNCGHDRMDLVKQFMNLSEVDIYGTCLGKECPKYPDPCTDLNSTYKFYLSFENQLCVDYVSEKVYKVLKDIVIPVVFNGAEMSRFLPPKSYIDANDFATPTDLANHLNFLSDHPEEYVKYFWWKKHYKVDRSSHTLCDICKKIHEPDLLDLGRTYSDMDRYFFQSCSGPKIKILS